jgi:hypothetical protein
LIAWTGVDGCLLKPVAPSTGESFEELVLDLELMLDAMIAERRGSGLAGLLAAPVFHSTDVFGCHFKKLQRFYLQKLRDLDIQTETLTPKGDAVGASIQDCDVTRTMIVGEPVHDIINVRRAVTKKANDSSDFIFDHQDMINPVSAVLCTGPKMKP